MFALHILLGLPLRDSRLTSSGCQTQPFASDKSPYTKIPLQLLTQAKLCIWKSENILNFVITLTVHSHMHNMKILRETLPKFTAFLASDCFPSPQIKKKRQEFHFLLLQKSSSCNDFTDKSMPFPKEFSFFFFFSPSLKNYNNFTMSPREWAHENAQSRQHEEKSLVIYFRRQQTGLSAALWE